MVYSFWQKNRNNSKIIETCGGGSRNRREAEDYEDYEYYYEEINATNMEAYGGNIDPFPKRRIQPRIHMGFGAEKEGWPWIVHLQFRF